MIELITGGSGSGKSEYAEARISALHRGNPDKPLIYIAAMKPFGDEAGERIVRHRKMRAGKGFITVERYIDIEHLSFETGSDALLECLGNLTANEMFSGEGVDNNCAERIKRGIDALARKCKNLCIITNEVFSDGIKYSSDTDLYMRKLAEINIYTADIADRVTEVVCSVPVSIKGGAD